MEIIKYYQNYKEYISLSDRAKNIFDTLFVSLALGEVEWTNFDIAYMCGCGVTTVKNSLKELNEKGLIESSFCYDENAFNNGEYKRNRIMTLNYSLFREAMQYKEKKLRIKALSKYTKTEVRYGGALLNE